MSEAPSAACMPVQKALVKLETRVAIRDEHGGQPHVAKHRPGQVACRLLAGGGLEGRDQPHAPDQEVDAHLQKVVAGEGDGQLEEFEVNSPAATRGNGERVQQAGRWQVVGLASGRCARSPPPPPASRAIKPSGAPGQASCHGHSARPAEWRAAPAARV